SDPEVITLGKIMIIKQILESEKHSKLYNFSNSRSIDATWLPEFLAMAISSTAEGQLEECFARITIVNFNYDRVIEHFLFSELREKLRIAPKRVLKAIDSLRILRPYGVVDALNWQGGAVAFGELPAKPEDYLTLSQNIKT